LSGLAGLGADGPERSPLGLPQGGAPGWRCPLGQPGEARDPIGRTGMAREIDRPATPLSLLLLGRLEEIEHPARVEPRRDDELHAQRIGLLFGGATVAELTQ